MLFPVPPAPPFPADHASTAEGHLRYEDLAQDGRLMPLALPPQLGGLWRNLLTRNPANRSAFVQGIVPLLTRLTLSTTPQHIRLDRPVEARGGYELAHDRDERGDVSRIFMNLWCEVHGATGRLFPPEPAGELALAGTMFAEHTFTRPFGPPDQRKVLALPPPFDPVPAARYVLPRPETSGELPAGARAVDDAATPDGVDHAFTLDQTDSNQHVNSLVYIQLFLEAAQRRFAARGMPLVRRSREVDIAYRKPCFAGDQVRIYLRAFEIDDSIGAAGYVAGTDGKPRCYVRTVFGS